MTTEETGHDAFDELVEAMPKIAEAVKAFPESVQGKAFDALMEAHAGNAPIASTDTGSTSAKTRRTRKTSTRKSKASDNGAKTTAKRSSSAPTMVKDLDLAPKGKASFKDFAAAKAPTSNNDKNVVIVYYLAQITGTSPITIDHVFTSYRNAAWKIPKNLQNSLAATASKKGYFNTSDLQDIRLEVHGINRVEHELPEKSKE